MSMYKVSYTHDKSPDGKGFNDPPDAFREISEEQFAQSKFDREMPVHIEYRQMQVNDKFKRAKHNEGKVICANLFWYSDGTGFAIQLDYYGKKVKYYAFGCNHDLDSKITPGVTSYYCKKCDSDVSHEWFNLVIDDSGWSMNNSTSNPRRGIRDYDRTIKFSQALSEDDMKQVLKYLLQVNCPGWTGVTPKIIGDNAVRFSTTYDSSD